MISFNQFINLKEALSLDDPLAQSTLKIKLRHSSMIEFESNLDNNIYKIIISTRLTKIKIYDEDYLPTELDTVNIMGISLQVNNSYNLTNKMGMQANIVYNMLLNAIKQAHDHFGENNIQGYKFVGAQSQQDIMYDRLMKRFAPNLITWSYGIHLKPETIQKIKDKNPDLIEEINNQIHQATSQREMSIKQDKEYKILQRKERIIP
jgi:hypothetical protein